MKHGKWMKQYYVDREGRPVRNNEGSWFIQTSTKVADRSLNREANPA